jgi:hypothetical protein
MGNVAPQRLGFLPSHLDRDSVRLLAAELQLPFALLSIGPSREQGESRLADACQLLHSFFSASLIFSKGYNLTVQDLNRNVGIPFIDSSSLANTNRSEL